MKYGTSFFAMSLVLTFLSAGSAQQEPAKPDPSSQPAASADSQPPKVIHREVPVYPPEARARRLAGGVLVEMVIDKQGNVTNPRVIQGDKILWGAALEAVKGWKFKPAMLDGQPVEQKMQIRITFQAPATSADAK